MNNESEMVAESTTLPPLAAGLPQIPVLTSVSCSFVLAVIYVGSLYVWDTKYNRDHPTTIKRRFASVSIVMLLAPLFVYFFSSPELLQREPFPKLLGFRWHGLWQAIVIPYLLTALLYLGPIYVNMQNESFRSYFGMFLQMQYNMLFRKIAYFRSGLLARLVEQYYMDTQSCDGAFE